ncbi:major facilitator superfamily domain-containing protein [Cantharellus anzutake]|uniref:major facilitator superfamily domain-containing protein n=1 Tax=Cantharellus anzutake TaxID=1750568 RepID=UPI0019080CE9|nr:major facilitator superfamily domain-containing protein [Cantharellus anzutake]KAF8326515.1 major facilitator superfamily domain-containing protein [Cantharellus anzutake]
MQLLPLLVLIYILNLIECNNIASARLANLENDLGLTEKQYDTCISILYIGYISMQVPSNIILSRIARPAYFLCGCMVVWGFLSACTGLTRNFTGLLLCRLLLGFAESAFFPGALYYISSWYTKKELALRIAFLQSGAQIGNAFGNLMAIGLLRLDGTFGIAGWRWLFLTEGIVTVSVALISMLILPDLPSSSTSSHLNPEQHEFAIWRLQRDAALRSPDEAAAVGLNMRGKIRGRISIWEVLQMVFVDGKVWMFLGVMMGICKTPTLGYPRNMTLLLTAPPYILCCIFMLLNGIHSDKTQTRFNHIICPLTVATLAHAVILSTTAVAPRYFAMLLLPASIFASMSVTWSWIFQTIDQPPEKRAAAFAFLNSICNSTNIWTSYLYTGPPQYLLAFSVNIVALLPAMAFATLTKWHLKRLNDAEEREGRKGRHVL